MVGTLVIWTRAAIFPSREVGVGSSPPPPSPPSPPSPLPELVMSRERDGVVESRVGWKNHAKMP